MASLSVHASGLKMEVSFLGLFEVGHYAFRPDQLVRLDKVCVFPWVGEGIRLHHTVAEYPEKMVFWCKPSAVLTTISATGFTAGLGVAAPAPAPRGFPLRLGSVFLIIFIWSCLLGYGLNSQRVLNTSLSPFLLAASFWVFLISFAALHSRSAQSLILRSGRSLGEVRPLFLVMTFITGVISLVLTWVFLA
jgi:hypothetical protein